MEHWNALSIACLARQIASSIFTQGELPQVSLSYANCLYIFVKTNHLKSSLIITLIAKQIAFDIFGKVKLVNPLTRLEHRIFTKENLLTQGEQPQVSLS